MLSGRGVYHIHIKRDRLTDLAEFLRIAEGLPSQTPLSDIFEIVRYRRESQLEIERRQAETLVRLVKVATEGGKFLDVVSHLYPDSIVDTIKHRQAEIEDEDAQLRRLEQVKAIARRFK